MNIPTFKSIKIKEEILIPHFKIHLIILLRNGKIKMKSGNKMIGSLMIILLLHNSKIFSSLMN